MYSKTWKEGIGIHVEQASLQDPPEKWNKSDKTITFTFDLLKAIWELSYPLCYNKSCRKLSLSPRSAGCQSAQASSVHSSLTSNFQHCSARRLSLLLETPWQPVWQAGVIYHSLGSRVSQYSSCLAPWVRELCTTLHWLPELPGGPSSCDP